MAFNHPFRVAAAVCLGWATTAGAVEPPIAKPAVVASADQRLADAVVRKLSETPGLNGYQVEIACLNGAVELEGRVKDAQQEIDLLRAVRAVKGVAKVNARLTTTSMIAPAQAVESLPQAGGAPAVSPAPVPMAPNSFGGGTFSPGPDTGMTPGGVGYGGAPITGAPMSGGSFGTDPTPIGMPPSAGLYDSGPPKMPPYAWPTYAPYNNYSRVGYPTDYPMNAFPFIGPYYPFPKVPLGFRAIKLEWEDGSWFYGRTATHRDWWKVRYW